MNEILKTLTPKAADDELKDIMKAIISLNEKVNHKKGNKKIDILWIGCKYIEVLKTVILLCQQKQIECNILVVEHTVDVPMDLHNCVFVKEDFVFFKCRELFDFIYNSVDGSASSVFCLKILCCCFFYHKPNILLMSHRHLFEQEKSIKKQSSGRRERHLFCQKNTKLEVFVRPLYRCFWSNTAFWSRKGHFIKVSNHCLYYLLLHESLMVYVFRILRMNVFFSI